MKFPLQCFSKITTGTTWLFAAPDSVQGGVGDPVLPVSGAAGQKSCGTLFIVSLAAENLFTGSAKLKLFPIILFHNSG
ncbi:hypothetical protein HanPI659440_Chr02g0081011 [Helianthus annuus]|nr:hypothetical protein HanPI659440_Chr02g0081011 [Helianthus annuus]